MVQWLDSFKNVIYKMYKKERAIGLMSRVFANGPGDRSSILKTIPKTQK